MTMMMRPFGPAPALTSWTVVDWFRVCMATGKKVSRDQAFVPAIYVLIWYNEAMEKGGARCWERMADENNEGTLLKFKNTKRLFSQIRSVDIESGRKMEKRMEKKREKLAEEGQIEESKYTAIIVPCRAGA